MPSGKVNQRGRAAGPPLVLPHPRRTRRPRPLLHPPRRHGNAVPSPIVAAPRTRCVPAAKAATQRPRTGHPGRSAVETGLAPPSQAAREAGGVIDQAVLRLNVYNAVMQSLSLQSDAARMRKLSAQALGPAQAAMEALPKLTVGQRHVADSTRTPMFIEQQRTMAAYYMVFTTPESDVDQLMEHLLRTTDTASNQAAWAQYVEEADKALAEVKSYVPPLMDTLKSYGKTQALDSIPGAEKILKMAAMGVTQARLIAVNSHVDRLALSIMMLANADVEQRFASKSREIQREFIGDVLHLRQAVDLLQDARVAPHPRETAWLEGYVNVLERHAQDHLTEATRHLPPDQDLAASPVGRAALELAKSIRLLSNEIGEVLNARRLGPEVAGRVRDLTAQGQLTDHHEAPIEQEEPTASKQESDAATQAASAGPSKPARKPRRSGKALQSKQPPLASKPELSVPHQVIIELAQERIHQYRKPPNDTGQKRFDFLALAEAMTQDTSHLRAATDAGIDPINAAHMMRNALAGWFGQPGVWAQRKSQLDKVVGSDAESPTAQAARRGRPAGHGRAGAARSGPAARNRPHQAIRFPHGKPCVDAAGVGRGSACGADPQACLRRRS